MIRNILTHIEIIQDKGVQRAFVAIRMTNLEVKEYCSARMLASDDGGDYSKTLWSLVATEYASDALKQHGFDVVGEDPERCHDENQTKFNEIIAGKMCLNSSPTGARVWLRDISD